LIWECDRIFRFPGQGCREQVATDKKSFPYLIQQRALFKLFSTDRRIGKNFCFFSYFNGNVTPGAWQHVQVNFQNDLWWSTEFGSSDRRTLAQWQQELQGVPVNYLEAGIGTTSGNTSASTSYIDYIHIKADRRDIDTTWDFEPDSPTSNVPTLSE